MLKSLSPQRVLFSFLMASSLYRLLFSLSMIPESQEKSLLVRTPLCGVAGREAAGLRKERSVQQVSVAKLLCY